ncbi:MAG: hydrogenase [Elusimicrobia bacterium]|nr:hydrogenase [Elusimicrobiota bacterium]
MIGVQGWLPQAVSFLTALALVSAFAALSFRTLHLVVRAYAAQSVLLGLAALAVGLHKPAWHITALALLTIGFKGFGIPWFLFKVMEDVKIRREAAPFIGYPASLLGGVGLTLVSYAAVRPVMTDSFAGRGLALGLTIMLLGLWLMVGRKKAVTQVVGLLIVDNGLFVAALSTSFSMPMIVELGLLFDLLVGVTVLGLLIFRIQSTFASIDTDRLTRLRG